VFHVVLYQPEIPPNTGNIIRLCANTKTALHLIEPLGFELDDARVRRAGLDYAELATLTRHGSWNDFLGKHRDLRLWAFSTHGAARYDRVAFQPSDGLVFGPETRGLPAALRRELGEDHILRIPMAGGSRSMNLSNAVAVVVYEALRQNAFDGLQ